MRLLLTSAGLTNKSIECALEALSGKAARECRVAFVPTASNTFDGDKFWVVNNIIKLHDLGYKIDFVDISALPKEMYLDRFGAADIIYVEGGDTFHLMSEIHGSEGYEDFKKIIQNKVYVGSSAGSAICSKDLALKAAQDMYDEGLDRSEDMDGFGLVPFYIFPHYGSREYFPKVTKESALKHRDLNGSKFYLLDDLSAVVIDGYEVKIISEGEWEAN